MRIIPYLTFNGNCKEAFAQYERVLGGTLFSMSFADAPANAGVPKDANLILHACLTVGDFSLMASDCPPGQPYHKPQGVSVSLNVDSEKEARRLFEGLSDGGKVFMSLEETFWAKSFAMFEDRFGIAWMVNYEGKQ
ncbi:VOC family protein [Pseudomonas gingeri]|uniref:VOC family protein n=1 Tax=Pseudomonas gingeri TaxID=117681 RepID=A0A7Y7YIE2_9PSED|nr:VOC family protein [Pseudomonas gingeri]NWA02775.1 VOC family protein [Pseudomonas gingeri]NWA18264.1 VOC family protein [Pseudomonas gingeri]NWA58946.1 VOC family protein [Pseudomonas gingeri]NWA99525.1 VOC family protein [Pseudomonas gingeri]NWB05530.1 VOC family protein [Pseudomonas gingeri]